MRHPKKRKIEAGFRQLQQAVNVVQASIFDTGLNSELRQCQEDLVKMRLQRLRGLQQIEILEECLGAWNTAAQRLKLTTIEIVARSLLRTKIAFPPERLLLGLACGHCDRFHHWFTPTVPRVCAHLEHQYNRDVGKGVQERAAIAAQSVELWNRHILAAFAEPKKKSGFAWHRQWQKVFDDVGELRFYLQGVMELPRSSGNGVVEPGRITEPKLIRAITLSPLIEGAKAVADYISQNPGANAKQIRHGTGVAESTFYRHIVPKLKAHGFVLPGRGGRGGYCPPPRL